MNKSSKGKRQWRVGELAQATGTTVRALHHYEQRGLLTSSERTSGGHRIYDASSIEQIYQILTLRELGLSIQEIKRAVKGGAALPELLRTHLARIELQLERMLVLRDRLRSLTSHANTPIDVDDLVATLKAMSRIESHIHTRRRERSMTDDDRGSRWRALGEQLRACMERGDAPCSEQAAAVANNVRLLINDFAGGDNEVLDALARLRTVSPPRKLAGWDPELMRYLELALTALARGNGHV